NRVLHLFLMPEGDNWKSWQLTTAAAFLNGRLQRPDPPVLDDTARNDIVRLYQQARVIAGNSKTEESLRLAAIRVLDTMLSEEAVTLLLDLLSPQQSQAIQSAALSSLGKSADQTVPSKLLGNWKTLTPAMRGQLLGLLMAREDWLARLLA